MGIRQIAIRFVLWWLRWWARICVARVKPTVIGVTGSVGKTSFLYLLDAILTKRFSVKTTFHGNSETGIPLEILGLRERAGDGWWSWLVVILLAPVMAFRRHRWDILLVEMGIDSPFPPKNMEYLLRIITPHIGVVLNVHGVHAQQFRQAFAADAVVTDEDIIDRIAQEKLKLALAVPEGGTVVLNSDDPRIRKHMGHMPADTLTVGHGPDASWRITGHRMGKSGSAFSFDRGKERVTVRIPSYALFADYGAVVGAAVAVARTLGMPASEIADALVTFRGLPPGRMTLLSGKKETTIIDSSYNASPQSVIRALEVLKGIAGARQRVVVMGDMRELGPLSQTSHEAVAAHLRKTAKRIVLVGPLTDAYMRPALEADPDIRVWWQETAEGLGEFLIRHVLRKGDTVLVKGSQNTIFLETVVEALLRDPADRKKLCRQSEEWERVRKQFFRTHPLDGRKLL